VRLNAKALFSTPCDFTQYRDTDEHDRMRDLVFREADSKRRSVVKHGWLNRQQAKETFPAGLNWKCLKLPGPFMTMWAPIDGWRKAYFDADVLRQYIGENINSAVLKRLKKFFVPKGRVSPRIIFHGFSPTPIAVKQPGKVQPASLDWIDFWCSNLWPEKILKRKESDPGDYATISGSWRFACSHFLAFFEETPNKINYFKLLKIFDTYGDELKLPYIGVADPQDMRIIKQRTKSHPGELTRRLVGHDKGACGNTCIEGAMLLWEHLEENVEPDTSLWTLGGRTRRDRLCKNFL
jgi:hypothetical protein